MNQGKKSVAHRSTPFGTQNRRVLQAAGSTICGAIARGAAAPAGGFAKPQRGRSPARLAGKRQRHRVFIVVAFTQQKLSE
ncbi:hypothetical protein WK67_01050 [Burkholderia ubonensis]|uniref:Uncharacterized protein n=1 Tax=Burkholderia ubonensis TaxID=101571 RepID=A0AAU8U7Z6_9BURK|nr:hypothetical protein [Burkholderia ubonensis]AOK21395.1 hypothetical protein WK67_01050 [Burkholderia ubonensis]